MSEKNITSTKLIKSQKFPGFEIVAVESTNIQSILSNPFFRDFNFLGLSKKFKGLRKNEDLKNIFKPVTVKTDIQLKLKDNQFITFIPEKKYSEDNKLFNVNNLFGPNDSIEPTFVNFGLEDVKIRKGDLLGVIIIQSASDDFIEEE